MRSAKKKRGGLENCLGSGERGEERARNIREKREYRKICGKKKQEDNEKWEREAEEAERQVWKVINRERKKWKRVNRDKGVLGGMEGRVVRWGEEGEG